MLPEIGGLELLLVAAVALIVVGPKDLPVMLRKLGQFMAKLRGMAAEFRASFDEMARQSELDELRKEVEAMRRGQLVDPASFQTDDVKQVFSEIDSSLQDGGVQMHPFAARPASAEPEAESEPEAPKPKRTRKPRAAVETEAAPKPGPRRKAAPRAGAKA